MKDYEILLVDDEEIILMGLGTKLEGDGYRVTKARSGKEAIDVLCTRKFDIVVTDLVMAEIDGIMVLKKAKEQNPETMVIILTAHGDMSSAIDALRFHAEDFLLKSFGPQEICIKVSRCLEKLELKKKIKIYEKLLPVCCVCKKVRDDGGGSRGQSIWMSIDKYIQKESGVDFTHTFCPECLEEYKKEM